MELLDTRRLTGPNLLWNKSGAIIDVSLNTEDNAVIDLWQTNVRTLLDLLGWTEESSCVRHYPQGASLAISAPIDVLYAATDINEWCWNAAVDSHTKGRTPDFSQAVVDLGRLIADEANPNVIQLQQFTRQHHLPFLRDDDEVSMGLGRCSQTWSVNDLPAVSSLDHSRYASIPVGLITGTNGKTTSTRLASHIIQSSALNCGISSTDWIAVNDEIIDQGDYSGPGGARTVLRDQRVDVAILETARGGLLRRGLGVEAAHAALITNVAEDHMGEFGVQTLEELADVKWIVTSVVENDGLVILNADDPLLISRAKKTNANIGWFSSDPSNPLIVENINASKTACTLENGNIIFYQAGNKHTLLKVEDIPITLQGAATHNVQNVLGVVMLTHALGIRIDSIITGLNSFSNQQNPGRCNQFNINDATVIVDFAHNPHGMKAFMSVARNLNAQRKILVTGQAGDRSDEDIKNLAKESTRGVNFDQIIIKMMKKYERGRAPGETAQILKDEYLHCGVDHTSLSVVEKEIDAVNQAIDYAQAGDLVILLIHEERERVLQHLAQLEQRSA